MALDTFLGGVGRAYQGAVDGEREARRDQRTQEVDAFDAKTRAANEALIPLRQEAATLQAQAQLEQGKTEIATAPARREAATTLAKGASAQAPKQVQLAASQLDRGLETEIFQTITAAANKPELVAGAQEKILGLAGKLLTENNMTGLNRVIEHAIEAPIFPGLNGLGKPVKTDVAVAPEGSVGVDGQPITGQALRVTFEDGSFKFISPKMLQTAYQKRLGAEQQSAVKIVKPGEAGIDTRTGKVLFERDPNNHINMGTDEHPNWIKVGGGLGVGGTGARGGGKAVDPGKPAGDAFEFIATKGDTKLTTDAVAKGARLTRQLHAEGGGRVPPELAAEVAYEVTKDPNKVVPAIDPRTGKIDGVFNHPEQGEFVISRGMASASNPGDLKPEQLRTLTAKLIEGQDPQIRTQMIAAAFDPKAKKQLIEGMFTEYDAAVDVKAAAAANPAEAASIVRAAEAVKKSSTAALNEKLSLIAKYSKPPATDKGAGNKAGLGSSPGVGPAYAVDPTSPAGKSQARQAEARQQGEARTAAAEAGRQAASKQFQIDRQSMPALELVRKYDKLRGNLPTQDAAELQKIERTL